MSKIGFMVFVVGMVVGTSLNATSILELPSGDPNAHTIELQSSNVFDGEFYVWTYKVTSGSGRDVHGISHWLFQICVEYFDHATDSGGTDISIKTESDPDPTLNIAGLKFNDEYDDDEMRTIKIYMTKSLETEELYVGIKSGTNLYYGYLDGPSCNCEEVPEPTTLALIGAGVLGLTSRRRRFL